MAVLVVLTPDEKARCRRALGYPNVSSVPSQALGVPIPMQTGFLLESAMDRLLPEAVPRVRELLRRIEDIERRMMDDAPDHLAAEKLGEMTLRSAKVGETYPDLLEREYRRWALRLADELSVAPYAYAERFRGGGINVRVH